MPKKKHKKTSRSRSVRRRRLNLFPIIFWLILLTLAGAVIYGGYKFLFDKSYDLPDVPIQTTTPQTPTQTKPTSNETTQSTSTDNTDTSATPDDGKTPKQYDGADANVAESLTGVISYAAFSGGKLVIRTNIDQYLSSGSCTLTLSDGTNVVSYSATIIPEASTSTCEGFDIPESKLTNLERPISITIGLSSGDRSGTITGRVN